MNSLTRLTATAASDGIDLDVTQNAVLNSVQASPLKTDRLSGLLPPHIASPRKSPCRVPRLHGPQRQW